MTRRSPIRHKVLPHWRGDTWVEGYKRGKGQRQQKLSRVVGVKDLNGCKRSVIYLKDAQYAVDIASKVTNVEAKIIGGVKTRGYSYSDLDILMISDNIDPNDYDSEGVGFEMAQIKKQNDFISEVGKKMPTIHTIDLFLPLSAADIEDLKTTLLEVGTVAIPIRENAKHWIERYHLFQGRISRHHFWGIGY